MRLFWPKRPFIFQWPIAPLSPAIRITADWGSKQLKGNKTWPFYYFRVFSEKNALWTFLSITTHNSYSKSRKLRETYIYSQRHSLALFFHYIIDDFDYRLQNKSSDRFSTLCDQFHFYRGTVTWKICYQNTWSLVLLPVKFLTKT